MVCKAVDVREVTGVEGVWVTVMGLVAFGVVVGVGVVCGLGGGDF